jgi:hypothetical protein
MKHKKQVNKYPKDVLSKYVDENTNRVPLIGYSETEGDRKKLKYKKHKTTSDLLQPLDNRKVLYFDDSSKKLYPPPYQTYAEIKDSIETMPFTIVLKRDTENNDWVRLLYKPTDRSQRQIFTYDEVKAFGWKFVPHSFEDLSLHIKSLGNLPFVRSKEATRILASSDSTKDQYVKKNGRVFIKVNDKYNVQIYPVRQLRIWQKKMSPSEIKTTWTEPTFEERDLQEMIPLIPSIQSYLKTV